MSSVSTIIGGPACPEAASEVHEPAMSDLVAMAVHDMKSPLAALRHALQLVDSGRAGEVPPSQARFLTIALDNAAVLGTLLDRLRGTLSGRSSADDIRPERMDLVRLAGFVVRAMQATAESRGVSLQLREATGLPDGWCDPVLLRRGLINLVTNALKYASCGGLVTIVVERSVDDPELLMIRVRDRGPGIPEEDHERVFEFGRRSEATCGIQDGTGLGLSIVRDIARAHGGGAWVTNNVGAGCTFSISVPVMGSARGARAQIRLMAPFAPDGLELIVLHAREGALNQLADAVSDRVPTSWRLLDLGQGRLGLLRARRELPRERHVAELRSFLAAEMTLVVNIGLALSPAVELEPEELIAAASTSPLDMDLVAPQS